MQLFFRNCTHILTRTKGKKFEDMFLVKIASKGTSLGTDYYFIYREGVTISGTCRQLFSEE